MSIVIKVGLCVAYDWPLLRHSLPLIYDPADVILITIDKNRRSWTGQYFEFDGATFSEMIKKMDPKGKIKIVEENFYSPDLSPMENEVYQRNRMAGLMGDGGWHIQIDCDEYFLNFTDFAAMLKKKNEKFQGKLNICCPFLILFKEVKNGFLLVSGVKSGNYEFVPVATRQPFYEFGRRNGYFNHHSRFFILHQSWARSEKEIKSKLNNWGHFNDFDSVKFIDLWKSADESNYSRIKNFHPIKPVNWPGLELVRASDINSLIGYFRNNKPELSELRLYLKNLKIISHFFSIFAKR
jgi:hypothetical protein